MLIDIAIKYDRILNHLRKNSSQGLTIDHDIETVLDSDKNDVLKYFRSIKMEFMDLGLIRNFGSTGINNFQLTTKGESYSFYNEIKQKQVSKLNSFKIDLLNHISETHYSGDLIIINDFLLSEYSEVNPRKIYTLLRGLVEDELINDVNPKILLKNGTLKEHLETIKLQLRILEKGHLFMKNKDGQFNSGTIIAKNSNVVLNSPNSKIITKQLSNPDLGKQLQSLILMFQDQRNEDLQLLIALAKDLQDEKSIQKPEYVSLVSRLADFTTIFTGINELYKS